MQSNPLRVEFVLTGLALLFAGLLLAEAIYVASDHATLQAVHDWRVIREHSGISVGALGVLLGAAYVVGIVVVQLTFFFPSLWLIVSTITRIPQV